MRNCAGERDTTGGNANYALLSKIVKKNPPTFLRISM